MAYFLLLWNPALDDSWLDQVKANKNSGKAQGRWSCGNRKNIQENDRVVMLRTGGPPKGLVGIGRVVIGSYQDANWNPDSARDLGNFIQVEWERADTTPYILQDDPDWANLSRIWKAQSGGIQIDDDLGEQIFKHIGTIAGDELDWSLVPTATEFVTFWSTNAPTDKQRDMLVAHYWSPEPDMHPQYLADRMDWSDASTANLHYGKFAGVVAHGLGVTFPEHSDNVSLFASILRGRDGQVRWRMHTSVRSAIEQLGWQVDGGPILTEPENRFLLFREGQQMSRVVRYRERSGSVRSHCISRYSAKCIVCGFEPSQRFG
jgi:hypothetical protein